MTRKAAGRSRRRSRRRGRCRRTAGCSGSPRARRSARSRRLLAEVRGTVYARAKAQEAGYGLETELAEPDGALVAAAAARSRRSRRCSKPLAALGRRLEAVLEDAPDWLDSAARARVEGAIRGLAWRRETLAAWIALLGRIGGEADPDFVDWLAVERVDGREYDVGIHRRWLDPTRPLARRCSRRRDGVLVTSATLRGGERWARRGGADRRDASAAPAERFEARSPFDYARDAEVLIVTDIARGDTAALAGAYARLIEAAGGGTLGPVHRDPAAESGPCADRRPAGPRRAAAARPACRPDRRRDPGRYLPRRSARLSARHRCAARRGRRAGRFAAAGGDGAGAVAAPDGAPRGAAHGRRRQRL